MENEKTVTQVKPHSLNYAGGRLSVSGVVEVKSFDEKLIVIALDGRTLTVKGDNFSVTELTVSGGNFAVNGTVTSLVYTRGKSNDGMLKRLFK